MRTFAATFALGAVTLGGDALGGCQLFIGLDEGTLRDGGPGAGGGDATGSSSSTTSSASSAGGGTSTTGAGGASTSATASASSASSSTASASSTSGAGGGSILPGNLIDDMESGKGTILDQGGRSGSWYTFNDTTGTQTPLAGDVCLPADVPGGHLVDGGVTSLHAQHTTGSAFTMWGAGLGFDLNHPGASPRKPYDAGAFTGIAFYAMGSQKVRIGLLEVGTEAAGGGMCSGTCGDSYGADVPLTSSWQRFAIDFSAMKQKGWGTVAPFDATTLLSVQFAVDGGPPFDFWIDDIGFY